MNDMILLGESLEVIAKLPNEDAGALIKALITGNGEGLPPMADLVYPMIKGQVDRMNEFREKQRANGMKGGRPKNPNKTQTKPNDNPNETQTEAPVPVPIPVPKERNIKERRGISRSQKVQAAMGFSTERQDVDYNKLAWEKMWEEG